MISLQSAMRRGHRHIKSLWVQEPKLEPKPVEIEPPVLKPLASKPKFPPPPEPELSPNERDRRRLEAWIMEWKLPPELPKHITMPMIKKVVCMTCNVTETDIMSRRNAPTYSIPRQIFYYLARSHTSRSFPEIGRFLGRDHTTVLSGVRRMGERRLTETDLNAKITRIEQQLHAMVQP